MWRNEFYCARMNASNKRGAISHIFIPVAAAAMYKDEEEEEEGRKCITTTESLGSAREGQARSGVADNVQECRPHKPSFSFSAQSARRDSALCLKDAGCFPKDGV